MQQKTGSSTAVNLVDWKTIISFLFPLKYRREIRRRARRGIIRQNVSRARHPVDLEEIARLMWGWIARRPHNASSFREQDHVFFHHYVLRSVSAGEPAPTSSIHKLRRQMFTAIYCQICWSHCITVLPMDRVMRVAVAAVDGWSIITSPVPITSAAHPRRVSRHTASSRAPGRWSSPLAPDDLQHRRRRRRDLGDGPRYATEHRRWTRHHRLAASRLLHRSRDGLDKERL